jgi:hypothetical protein
MQRARRRSDRAGGEAFLRVGSEIADVSVLRGADEIEAVAKEVEGLAVAAPVTAQWWWLRTWMACHRSWQPWGLLLREPTGEATGVALLAERRRLGVDEIVALGYGQSDYQRLLVRGPANAPTLGRALASALSRRRRPWRLYLNELPGDDATARVLAATLPHAVVEPGAGAAVIDVGGGLTSAMLRPNARKRVRRARNHLARDNRLVAVERLRGADDIGAVLPSIETVHVSRDHALRGTSDLDDAEHRAFWYAVIEEAARRDAAEVTTLTVDGRLGAHLVAFRDGSSYRVWDCRLLPEFEDYGLGHVIRDEVLDALAAEGGWTEFDWMRGVEEYKLRTATRVVEACTVRAWSSGWLAVTERGAKAARRRWRR